MPRVNVGRRDPAEEAEAKEWIQVILGKNFPSGASYEDCLRNGVALCELINILKPGSVKKIHTTGSDFKYMENIENFTKAMVTYGCSDQDLFQTPDLWDKKDIAKVTNSIFALGRETYRHPEFKGPWLGPKPSEENVREFDDETIAAGKTAIGLQAGSNKGASQAGQNFGAGRKIIIGK